VAFSPHLPLEVSSPALCANDQAIRAISMELPFHFSRGFFSGLRVSLSTSRLPGAPVVPPIFRCTVLTLSPPHFSSHFPSSLSSQTILLSEAATRAVSHPRAICRFLSSFLSATLSPLELSPFFSSDQILSAVPSLNLFRQILCQFNRGHNRPITCDEWFRSPLSANLAFFGSRVGHFEAFSPLEVRLMCSMATASGRLYLHVIFFSPPCPRVKFVFPFLPLGVFLFSVPVLFLNVFSRLFLFPPTPGLTSHDSHFGVLALELINCRGELEEVPLVLPPPELVLFSRPRLSRKFLRKGDGTSGTPSPDHRPCQEFLVPPVIPQRPASKTRPP